MVIKSNPERSGAKPERSEGWAKRSDIKLALSRSSRIYVRWRGYGLRPKCRDFAQKPEVLPVQYAQYQGLARPKCRDFAQKLEVRSKCTYALDCFTVNIWKTLNTYTLLMINLVINYFCDW